MPKTDSTPETFEETVDSLNGAIDDACVEIVRLRTVNADLLASLKALINDIDNGVLVRDVTHDGESGWSMQMLSFVRRLQDAQVAIARAEGRS